MQLGKELRNIFPEIKETLQYFNSNPGEAEPKVFKIYPNLYSYPIYLSFKPTEFPGSILVSLKPTPNSNSAYIHFNAEIKDLLVENGFVSRLKREFSGTIIFLDNLRKSL